MDGIPCAKCGTPSMVMVRRGSEMAVKLGTHAPVEGTMPGPATLLSWPWCACLHCGHLGTPMPVLPQPSLQ
jgi:hypothetical protein